jgi:hypothetical protein
VTKNQILIDLSESEKTKIGKEEFVQQSVPQQGLFGHLGWEVESEVNNGGFSQYFLNDSAESAAFVVHALESIGAPKTAEICRRAIFIAFPAGVPPTVEAIRMAAGDFSEEVLDQLAVLDQEFFAYPHDLTDLLFAHVQAHPDEFGTLPTPDDAEPVV